MQLEFLIIGLIAAMVGLFLLFYGIRWPRRAIPASIPAVLSAVCFFFAVGLILKGLGIASPMDSLLVPPPLPK